MSAWLTRAVLVQRAVVLGGASSNAAVAVARQHRSLTAAPCCQRRGGRRRADPGMAQLKAMLANHETQLNTGDAVGATANGGNPLQNAPLPSMEKLQALESSLNRGGEFGAAGTRAATEEVGGTAEGGTAANPDLQPRRQRGVRASRRRRVRDGTAEEIEMREMQEFLEQNKHLLQDNEEEGGGGASANESGGSGRPSQRGRARSRYRQDHPANGGSGDASGAGGAGAGAGAGGSQRQSEDAMYAQLFAELEEQQQEATGGKGGRKPKQQQPQFDNTKKGRRLRDRAASAAAAEAWNDPDSAKVTFGFDPSTFRRGAEDRPDGEAGEDFYDDYDTDGAHGGPVQLDPRDLLPELAALMQQQTGGKDLPPELVAMLQELEAEEGGGGDGGGDDQDMYDDDDVEYYDDEDGVDGNGDGDVDDFYYEGADDDGDDDVDGVVDMEDGRSLGVSLGSLGLRKQTTAQSHKPRPAPTDESELAALFSAPIPGQQRAGAEIEYEDEAEDEDEDGGAEDEADDDFSAFTGVEGGLEVDPFAALSAAAAAAASGMDVKSQVRFRLGKLPSNRKEGDGSEDIDSPEGFQSIRQRRIAGATQRAITKAVGLRQCGDKLTDLGFEVSHVTLAKGFRHAWVYWHATGDGAVDDQIEGQLNEQAVRIRQVVTRNLNLKFSAELRFNKTDVRMRMDELDTLFEQVGTELQATQARELRDEEQAKRAAKDAKRKKHGRRR